MKYLVCAMLVVVGVIHLLPLTGVLSSERLMSLYSIRFNEPNLAILMRHRAVLIGLFGTLFLVAAFKPEYQVLAIIAGYICVLSFLLLVVCIGNTNAQVQRVFAADVIALASLVIATLALTYLRVTATN